MKNAHKNRDFAALDTAIANLNSMWQTASEEMYKNASQSGDQGSQQGGPKQEPGQSQQGPKGTGNDEVTDVDFEEVKDK